MLEEAKERIQQYIEPIISEQDLEIVEFSAHRHGKTIAVVLIVDYLECGINIDECSMINKEVAKLIEEEHLLVGDYTVEVSSPGLDRPLLTYKDFKRVAGKKVKFHLKDRLDNKIEHDGVVKEVMEENVVVDLKEKTLNIPLSLIQKAVQII